MQKSRRGLAEGGDDYSPRDREGNAWFGRAMFVFHGPREREKARGEEGRRQLRGR